MNAPSNVPRAARRQVREANRLITELNTAPQPAAPALQPQPAAPAAPAASAPQPGLRDEPQFAVVGEQVDLDRWRPASASIAPARVPGVPDAQPLPQAPAPDAQPPAAPAADAELEHRFRVLQGKYNAETAENRRILAQQQETINQLLASSQQRQPNPAPTAAAPSREQQLASLGVTAAEAESFGPELVDMMARIAGHVAGPAIQQVNQRMQGVERTVAGTVQHVAKSAQQLVWDHLKAWETRKGVSWEMINTSNEFLDWLQGLDIFSGTPRAQGLRQAFDTSDATRVVGIFEAFVEEDARSRATSRRTPQVDRETLLAPGRGRGEAPAAPDGSSGKIWSEQEIRDFYSRVQRNRITPEEKAQVSAEIGRAMKEGRVKPDHSSAHLSNVPY